MRVAFRQLVAFTCAGALLGATEPGAQAAPPGGSPASRPTPVAKRSIAVLEFRGGATGAKNVGQRMAAILRRRTSHLITDGDDARRLVGVKIDDAVARCGGAPACIGAIGKKLGVDTVLLVGVSELGDLILALQLIDSAAGKVEARVADSLPRDTDPNDDALEGYLRRIFPPAEFLRWGTLRIQSDVAGADVAVGGTSHGQTPLEPILVPAPSKIDLRVSKSGYIDFSASIDVNPDATVEVRPILTPQPGSAWYEKWWVWAIVGGVVAGGVTTAIILTQPESQNVPIDIRF